MIDQLAYIAAPYTDKDPAVIEWRINQFLAFDNLMISRGYLTVSPLSKHFCLNAGHPIDGTYNFWGRYSRSLLSRCDVLFVLMLPGWENSTGVADEIECAKKRGIPVYFFGPEDTSATPVYVSFQLTKASQ